jgi:hypothetical protein
MPVVEFALDPAMQHRVQVHLPPEPQASVTIMLNRSILGSLTPDEQTVGKYFRLPDNSFVNVRIVNGQPQVSRAGYLLPLIDVATANAIDSASDQERKKKLGGCLVAWLSMNLVVIGGLTLLYFLAIIGAMSTGTSPLPFLLFGLLGIVGLVGIILIFLWKKLGFYLAATYVVLGLLLSIPFGLLNARSFIPLASIAILYVYLNRSGCWEKMS